VSSEDIILTGSVVNRTLGTPSYLLDERYGSFLGDADRRLVARHNDAGRLLNEPGVDAK